MNDKLGEISTIISTIVSIPKKLLCKISTVVPPLFKAMCCTCAIKYFKKHKMSCYHNQNRLLVRGPVAGLIHCFRKTDFLHIVLCKPL